MIKKLIPASIKLKIHLIRRAILAIFNGHFFLYAKKRESNTTFSYTLEVTQDLKPSGPKEHNLSIAIKAIESIEIQPNEVFSFWKAVGHPSKKRGFVESRSIINGEIQKSVGGGLCQLAGLLYYVSLLAQLPIIERHNHSIDIYTDETRFAPLGSDATVAYGYKDLRIKNNLSQAIKFTFSLQPNKLTVTLHHSDKIEKSQVFFEKKNVDNNRVEVLTVLNEQTVAKSLYRRVGG